MTIHGVTDIAMIPFKVFYFVAMKTDKVVHALKVIVISNKDHQPQRVRGEDTHRLPSGRP
jgi:hypothetical protein